MHTSNAPVVELARHTLANELGCESNQVIVVSVEAVTWPDSSLGCPQPGMMYLQVITPGYAVVLEHDGRRYTYHTDRGQRVVRCDRGRPPNLLPTM
jgi:hypothetical protein